jgi:hypothetical protein
MKQQSTVQLHEHVAMYGPILIESSMSLLLELRHSMSDKALLLQHSFPLYHAPQTFLVTLAKLNDMRLMCSLRAMVYQAIRQTIADACKHEAETYASRSEASNCAAEARGSAVRINHLATPRR